MTAASFLARLRRRLRPASRITPLILMYHRVAAVQVDPWRLAVAPERFADHLQVLRATRRPLSMSEFVRRSQAGTLPFNAVAITFDDGYSDTLRHAKPLLGERGLPATLFLATGFVGQAVEYWWDELARAILNRKEGLDDELVIGEARRRLRLAAVDETTLASRRAWCALDTPRTEREMLYYTLWERLRVLRKPECDATMSALRALLRTPAPHHDDLPMTASEVAELAADRAFDIGGHTATHRVLTMVTPAERQRDILIGKTEGERLTGRETIGFAYPHGAHDAASRAAVAECGYRWACTSRSGPASPSNRYSLPRVMVLNWGAAAFEQALAVASA